MRDSYFSINKFSTSVSHGRTDCTCSTTEILEPTIEEEGEVLPASLLPSVALVEGGSKRGHLSKSRSFCENVFCYSG